MKIKFGKIGIFPKYSENDQIFFLNLNDWQVCKNRRRQPRQGMNKTKLLICSSFQSSEINFIFNIGIFPKYSENDQIFFLNLNDWQVCKNRRRQPRQDMSKTKLLICSSFQSSEINFTFKQDKRNEFETRHPGLCLNYLDDSNSYFHK